MKQKNLRLTVLLFGLVLTGILNAINIQNTTAATTQTTCKEGTRYCQPAGQCIGVNDLCILEPPPGYNYTRQSPPGAAWGLEAFNKYINGGVWTWVFAMGVAIAILNGVYAGFQIVMSNGDPGIIGQAKERFVWTTIGLIVLILTGVIMNFLNPYAFTNA
ncbi:hypothetical protein A3A67_04860 [Candidatus Peribacteria bacterium RIFCSPLOWO2_01_FULL_51_18]|nr:MAG: hypothetical protein A3C52_02550 [Candidatus Peribacteria bacterium RIFCSPHIGHO2_02_FULL_51_15]OGJ66076.1 MAG: hypothetical protein A3A67_04860 [Candidatus Peribacteria bacterium RIFCSPLOWO2_01_FULL_51_18]OGJ69884.1 MAG: hypothetical protein A3J34_03120 [Candidatus Peribacteria bacterium RIFCSPLOWO2_02_FULL_51_10]